MVDRPLYFANEQYKDSHNFRTNKHDYGRALYQRFTTAVNLTEQWRCNDPKWQSLLTAIRQPPHAEGWKYKHTKYLQEMTLPVSTLSKREQNHDADFWAKAKLCTPRRLVRDYWNHRATSVYAETAKEQIFQIRALDRTDEGKPLSKESIAQVAALKGKQAPVCCLVPCRKKLKQSRNMLLKSSSSSECTPCTSSIWKRSTASLMARWAPLLPFTWIHEKQSTTLRNIAS